MNSAQHWLDVVAHNLANVSTTGYKREGVAFNDTLTRALYGQGVGYLGELGAGPTFKSGSGLYVGQDMQRADGKDRLETKA